MPTPIRHPPALFLCWLPAVFFAHFSPRSTPLVLRPVTSFSPQSSTAPGAVRPILQLDDLIWQRSSRQCTNVESRRTCRGTHGRQSARTGGCTMFPSSNDFVEWRLRTITHTSNLQVYSLAFKPEFLLQKHGQSRCSRNADAGRHARRHSGCDFRQLGLQERCVCVALQAGSLPGSLPLAHLQKQRACGWGGDREGSQPLGRWPLGAERREPAPLACIPISLQPHRIPQARRPAPRVPPLERAAPQGGGAGPSGGCGHNNVGPGPRPRAAPRVPGVAQGPSGRPHGAAVVPAAWSLPPGSDAGSLSKRRQPGALQTPVDGGKPRAGLLRSGRRPAGVGRRPLV